MGLVTLANHAKDIADNRRPNMTLSAKRIGSLHFCDAEQKIFLGNTTASEPIVRIRIAHPKIGGLAGLEVEDGTTLSAGRYPWQVASTYACYLVLEAWLPSCLPSVGQFI